MKLVQCPKKHYYDADKYSECPVCNPSSAMKQSRVVAEDDDDKTVALNVDESQVVSSQPKAPVENDDVPKFNPDNGESVSDQAKPNDDVQLFDPETGKPNNPNMKVPPVSDEPIYDPVTGERRVTDKKRFNPMTGERESYDDLQLQADVCYGKPLGVQDDDQTKPLDMPHAKPVARDEDIQNMIQHSTATVSEDDDATVPLYASGDNAGKSGRGYVVGWLVAVNGPAKGKSYELYAGKNSIGRLSSQDVCIDNDRSIARNKHAVVIFDPKEKQFIAMPGESKELYYVNDKLVLGPVTLKDRDQLSLGETELMLIPLCDDHFNWDTEKED